MLKNIYKVSAFALPICANALINMATSFVAMLMVARISKAELAAGALAISTYIAMVTIVATIFYAVGILISHSKGGENSEKHIGKLVKNGYWLALFLALPSFLLLWNADSILYFMGQNPVLVKLTLGYFHFAALSILPILIASVINQFFIGKGNPRFVMTISMINMPFIMLLSYGLILGHFGLHAMGLAGVTCATLIVQTSLCIFLTLYMLFSKKMQGYAFFSGNLLPEWSVCKMIIKLGFPIGIQFGGELAAMAVGTYFMGYMGVDALAVSQIVSQYSMLAVMIMLGLSQALSMLISEAYAKRDNALIKEYITSATVILVTVFTLILGIFTLFPHYLTEPFINIHDPENAAVKSLAAGLFIVAGINLLADGIRNLYSGSLRGLHDSKAPMNIGLICLWAISLPASYIIGLKLHGGPIGLRLGFTSGFIIAAFILWQRISEKVNGAPITQTANAGIEST